MDRALPEEATYREMSYNGFKVLHMQANLFAS